jgi:hypothetical protein
MPGTNISHSAGERIKHVSCDEDRLTVELTDGRLVAAPLVWYPRLLRATAEARSHWQLAGGGYGVHWPELDEDLSVEGLLRGIPSVETRRAASES